MSTVENIREENGMSELLRICYAFNGSDVTLKLFQDLLNNGADLLDASYRGDTPFQAIMMRSEKEGYHKLLQVSQVKNLMEKFSDGECSDVCTIGSLWQTLCRYEMIDLMLKMANKHSIALRDNPFADPLIPLIDSFRKVSSDHINDYLKIFSLFIKDGHNFRRNINRYEYCEVPIYKIQEYHSVTLASNRNFARWGLLLDMVSARK